MSAPVWTDDDESSILIIGPTEAPVIVSVERWGWSREGWSVCVAVGRGAWLKPFHRSGHKAPGHPSREAAKAAGLEALSAWLRTVAEQTSAAIR